MKKKHFKKFILDDLDNLDDKVWIIWTEEKIWRPNLDNLDWTKICSVQIIQLFFCSVQIIQIIQALMDTNYRDKEIKRQRDKNIVFLYYQPLIQTKQQKFCV